MSEESLRQAEAFLAIAGQFRLGELVTEAPHPVTADLSGTARRGVPDALGLLFEVDRDVVDVYGRFEEAARRIGREMEGVVAAGGRLFFTGCGATGRLSILLAAMWRGFWQRQTARGMACDPPPGHWEDRALSVMAGGDFALIKSVEGFEDLTAFGRRQLADMGVRAGDLVFAITEGGETSFVIGTAWEGLERGAAVWFVYNNPDDLLRATVERSRAVVDEPRIRKLNLTTGPMAITGSTRMQATSIQLCVLGAAMESALRGLARRLEPGGPCDRDPETAPGEVGAALREAHAALQAEPFRAALGSLVEVEEATYRAGGRASYFADRFGIDVLTDTTERSPTFCTPPFRQWDETSASESWAFLFLPDADTQSAWRRVLRREPWTVGWSAEEVRAMAGAERAERLASLRIGRDALMRFRIGLDGLPHRPLRAEDLAVCILGEGEDRHLAEGGFGREALRRAGAAGASGAALLAGDAAWLAGAVPAAREAGAGAAAGLAAPRTRLLLDLVTRVAVKMALNALSTCTMVRLGRVMGNTMVWVAPGNRKLIDRATRYVQRLARLEYAEACRLVFEVIEYVAPRMRADRAYPPVVGIAVLRARRGLTNEAAEARIREDPDLS